MAKLGEDWLGAFIASEVAAAIDWANNPKRQPGTLFSDDDSNLRKRVSLKVGKAVQLRRVFSVDDDATVLLSDGFTHIRANLSDEAVAILENEIETKMDESTTGDVFFLREFTIRCTTIGEENKFVTLDVDDIEYRYHLRKAQGVPEPIEERPDIRRLLEMIKQWRMSVTHVDIELDWDPGPNAPPPVQSQVLHSSPPARSQVSAPSQAIPDADSAGRTPSVNQRQPKENAGPATQSQDYSMPFATQVQGPRPGRPSLSKDGLEYLEGINLARPVAAPGQITGAKPVISNLASLLSMGAPKKDQRAPAVPANGDMRSERSNAHSEVDEPEPATIEDDLPGDDVMDEDKSSSSSSSSSYAPEEGAENVAAYMCNTRLDDSLLAVSSRKRKAVSPPPVDRIRPRGSHTVALSQQGLLNKPSCWFPALPHERFPLGNVPVNLLTVWMRNTEPGALERASVQEADGDLSSSVSSSSISDSDEEFDESEWPPTPVRQPELPPDSSLEGSPRSHRLPVRPPRIVEPASSAGYTIRGTPSASQDDFMAPPRLRQTQQGVQHHSESSRRIYRADIERPYVNSQGSRKGSQAVPLNAPRGPAAERNRMTHQREIHGQLRNAVSPPRSSPRIPVSSSPIHYVSQRDSARSNGASRSPPRHPSSSQAAISEHPRYNAPYPRPESWRRGLQSTPDTPVDRQRYDRDSCMPDPRRWSASQHAPASQPPERGSVARPQSYSRSVAGATSSQRSWHSLRDYSNGQSVRVADTYRPGTELARPSSPPSSYNAEALPPGIYSSRDQSNGAAHGFSHSRFQSPPHAERIRRGSVHNQHSQRRSRSPQAGPANGNGSSQRLVDRRVAQSRSSESTRGTVIPGTQYPAEPPKPSPQGTDPSVRHRNRRTEYMWNEIRQAWVAAEYDPDLSPDKVFARYQAEHRKDSINFADFNTYLEKKGKRARVPSRDASHASTPSRNQPSRAPEEIPPNRRKRRISTPPDDEPPTNTFDTTFSIDRTRDPTSTARKGDTAHFSSSILDKANMPPPTSTAKLKHDDSKQSETPPEPIETYSALLRVVQRKHAPELQRDPQDIYREFARKYARQRKGGQVFPKAEGMRDQRKVRRKTDVLSWGL